MKLEISYKKKTGKITNMDRLNNMLLSNQWVNEEIKGEIKKYFETNENGNTTYQKFMGCSRRVSKREVHSDTCLPQETRIISNNLTLHLK